MNKAFLFFLVILIQSQSDGVLLSSANIDDQMENLESSDAPYLLEIMKDNQNSPQLRKRVLTSDTFTRRSALDKNFMRFGRGDRSCTRDPSDKLAFYRFGRGVKDSFIRFGRGRDNFIRFGRSRPDDFFRSGKSLRENFIRFGRADRNFMRFGRDNVDDDNQDYYSSEEPFERIDKSAKDNFIRFGKSGKEGRNGTNFLRFGKSEGADEAEGDSSKEARRRKRETSRKEGEKSPVEKSDNKRETGFFDEREGNFARNLSPISSGNSWQNLGSLRDSRLTPFFPVSSNLPRNNYF